MNFINETLSEGIVTFIMAMTSIYVIIALIRTLVLIPINWDDVVKDFTKDLSSGTTIKFKSSLQGVTKVLTRFVPLQVLIRLLPLIVLAFISSWNNSNVVIGGLIMQAIFLVYLYIFQISYAVNKKKYSLLGIEKYLFELLITNTRKINLVFSKAKRLENKVLTSQKEYLHG